MIKIGSCSVLCPVKVKIRFHPYAHGVRVHLTFQVVHSTKKIKSNSLDNG